MPMPRSFPQPTGRVAPPSRAPIAWALVAGVVAAAATIFARGPGVLLIVGSVVITITVVIVNAVQRHLGPVRTAVHALGAGVGMVVAFALMPMLFVAGPLVVPAVVSFAIFFRRNDTWGCVAAFIAGVTGVVLRFVLSVGDLSYPVFVVLVVGAAALAVFACVRMPVVASRRPA
ncbi:hypothetical protein [Cellulomonas septica]|uniref:Uncharacterized protein n=1 Tax=Cellulomonas septica TaxID=285080 RepID=A0ABX1JWE9_9CELL|nr:hypothetical protein [Cellulomonas septica]NKY38620.1 hypothetical protein [Cellulomonas septica]